MSTFSDKELQTRLQFLQEAEDGLNTLEDSILEMAQGSVDPNRIDAALRAAHSIKGGAGMMQFTTLNEVAHRLEDTYKVIKIRRPEVEMETINQLLACVDCMRQIIQVNRQGIQTEQDADPVWVQQTIDPIFVWLNEHVGELQAGDEEKLLTQESGQDVVAVLFQTEVEGCLTRLEEVLNQADHRCLDTELTVMAQELAGLADMLELANFSQLCHSVIQHLQAHPAELEAIAREALQEWRRSQALVTIGQSSLIPMELVVPEISVQSAPLSPLGVGEIDLSQDPDELDNLRDLLSDLEQAIEQDPGLAEETADSQDLLPDLPGFFPAEDLEPSAPSDLSPVELGVVLPDHERADPMQSAPLSSEAISTPAASESGMEESMIRVPVSRLDQVNDLCGELTIGCNGLDLRLSRLRSLMGILVRRVRELEESNVQLRSAYDRVATQAVVRHALPGLKADILQLEDFDILELDRYGELHPIWQQVMETIVWLQEVTGDMDLLLQDAEQTGFEFTRTARQLQNHVTRSRMRPLNDLVSRFPRAIYNMSSQYGKPVDLVIRGASTLLDRSVIDKLSDPLMHLVRNAFDHGIEDPETRRRLGKPAKGKIEIRAGYRGNQTLIAISDDGAGINLSKIRAKAERLGFEAQMLASATDRDLIELIFAPGFSTAEAVTTLSGRGVGMDVVKSNLDLIGGTITVDTEAGAGTTFTISVPFTLSVMRVLMVESYGMLLAFPADTIEQMILFDPSQLVTTNNCEAVHWEGYMVPKVELGSWLSFNCPKRPFEIEDAPMLTASALLILAQANDLACVEIARCWGEREVAIRQVEGPMPMPAGFSGCTILGDGQVVPIVNVLDLFEWADQGGRRQDRVQESADLGNGAHSLAMGVRTDPTILVVDDSINVRRFLALALEKAGYRTEQAKDGQDALDKLTAGLPVDAVICDIEMPRLDGFGFLAQLKRQATFKDLPILMLTSRTADKHRQLAMNLGASGYFTKPCKEKDLIQAVNEQIQVQQTSSVS